MISPTQRRRTKAYRDYTPRDDSSITSCLGYCMNCGKEHNEITCPNCGSKAKRVG
ncbi:MAG TPA: hypothetical protein VKA95_05500 [Nitrososphaeraceae archaeon]|nr:hypothetical protein [Nitrososphaeraceae archaeon]